MMNSQKTYSPVRLIDNAVIDNGGLIVRFIVWCGMYVTFCSYLYVTLYCVFLGKIGEVRLIVWCGL